MAFGPLAGDLHVDGLLTNVSLAYRNPLYIVDSIAPPVEVMKQSDIIPQYDQSHWFRDLAEMRAPGTKSARGGYKVDLTATYYCHRYSYAKEVYDDQRRNADSIFDLDRDATDFVTDKIQMRKEVNFVDNFFKTGVWTTDKDGGVDFTKWDDYGSSAPLNDLVTYRDAVEALIGREPNKLVLGKQVWNTLKWHPDLVETIKYTQKGQISLDLFASLAEFEQVLIGRTIKTTTNPGTAESSVTYSRIWGKHALGLYVPTRPAIMTPAAIYTFVWRYGDAGQTQWIKRMRDEEREADIIEANTYFDQKLTGARAGFFLENAVS